MMLRKRHVIDPFLGALILAVALPLLAQDTLKNFNANPGDRPADYTARMLALLEAAW